MKDQKDVEGEPRAEVKEQGKRWDNGRKKKKKTIFIKTERKAKRGHVVGSWGEGGTKK